jgi:hypothetical protein
VVEISSQDGGKPGRALRKPSASPRTRSEIEANASDTQIGFVLQK